LLDNVLKHVVKASARHMDSFVCSKAKAIRPKLVIHAAVGFQETYLRRNHSISADESWPKTILQKDHHIVRFEEEKDEQERRRMAESAVQEIIALPRCVEKTHARNSGAWLQVVFEI